MQGHLESFGRVWYDPDQVVNILGFAELRDRFKVTYDWKDDYFMVEFKTGPIKFARTKEGLYAFRPIQSFKERVARHKNMTPPPELKPRSDENQENNQAQTELAVTNQPEEEIPMTNTEMQHTISSVAENMKVAHAVTI